MGRRASKSSGARAVRLVLDTSVLRSDPAFRGGATEAVLRFAEAGFIQLFLPAVVAGEAGTPTSEARKTAAAALKHLAVIERATSGDFNKLVSATVKSLAPDAFADHSRQIFQDFVERSRASVLMVGPDHGKRVFERYFAGLPPFSASKSRKDIPDAFVYECVADLSEDHPIVFACSDVGLAIAAAGLRNVTVVSSFRDLLEVPQLLDLQSDVEEANVAVVMDVLLEDQHTFDVLIDDEVSGILGGSWVSPSYANAQNGDEEDAFIETAGPVLKWEIEPGSAEYLGEGVIAVSFNAEVAVTLDVSTGNYYYDMTEETTADAKVLCEGRMTVAFPSKAFKQPLRNVTGPTVFRDAVITVDELVRVTVQG